MPEKNEMEWLTQLDRDFAATMKSTRERLGLTQADVASRCRDFKVDITLTTVARIESGRRAVRLGEAHALAAVLGIQLDSRSPIRASLDAELAAAQEQYAQATTEMERAEERRHVLRDRIWDLQTLIQQDDESRSTPD